ncbi:MAG: DUF535 family protein [Methylophilaceae bacterium]
MLITIIKMSTILKPSVYLRASNLVTVSRQIYQSSNMRALWCQWLFCLAARKNMPLLIAFSQEINQLGYEHIFKLEPNILGNLIWPYIHKDWNVTQRFASIARHYALLKDMPKFLDVSNGSSIEIVNLSAFSANTILVLDKPRWFVREGEIVLNIFQNDLRVMSVAFTLGYSQNELVLYIGGIQGIHSGVSSEKSLEIIKHLTKDFNGLRPRSFVLVVLRMIATRVGASKILAIDQAHRHHWHPFFKSPAKNLGHANYDEIWKDNDGVAGDDGFYQLKTSTAHKDLNEIDSKKRSMYRKRFDMLDQIQQQISILP